MIRFWEYENFREKGIPYAIHSNELEHRHFNYSFLSYLDGEKKKNRDHCEVLGFWGDITVGPFWTFGLCVSDLKEYEQFYKKVSDKYYYYNEKFSEYQVEKMINDFQLVNISKI